MADLILLKRSATAGSVPAPTQLTTGELAINTADAKMYMKKANGTVAEVSGIKDGEQIDGGNF